MKRKNGSDGPAARAARDASEILRLKCEIERLQAIVHEQDRRLGKLDQRQKDLVRHLSHDLKTPLTPLVTILPLMRSMIDDGELREMLDVVLDSVGYINAIVEQSLALAQVESDEVIAHLDRVNLATTLDNVAARHDFAKLGITLEVALPEHPYVTASALLLDEIFENLFSNAIKFMDGPGQIRVTAQPRDTIMRIAVQDTGSGMTPSEVDHVFDEFFKADASRHDLASTGLGMSKTKRLVEKIGGDIRVTSAGKGRGTKVELLLRTEHPGAS